MKRSGSGPTGFAFAFPTTRMPSLPGAWSLRTLVRVRRATLLANSMALLEVPPILRRAKVTPGRCFHMAVRQASYRRPATPEGLRAIETDTLNWYSPELYANFNTGVLEEYLEERNRRDSFEMCPWSWKAIMIGIVIGTVFAFITEYVGLKVGLAVAGG